MSSNARAAYEALPPCSEEEIRLAKLPAVIKDNQIFLLDSDKLIPLKEAYEKAR